jgi:hypothetical protein
VSRLVAKLDLTSVSGAEHGNDMRATAVPLLRISALAGSRSSMADQAVA